MYVFLRGPLLLHCVVSIGQIYQLGSELATVMIKASRGGYGYGTRAKRQGVRQVPGLVTASKACLSGSRSQSVDQAISFPRTVSCVVEFVVVVIAVVQ